ncbi:MAG: thiolase family protein [Novosphingobium sp.]|nr:thiolase family protein [Novosphingobium sp.]
MSYGTIRNMPAASRDLSRKAAIVGVGETDYHQDYLAERAKVPGYESPTVETLSLKAFERALADCGLTRDDIDGLSVSFTFGGPEPREMAELLGVKPDYCEANGNIMAGPLPVVSTAIAEGKADTVAMIFCVASRSLGRQFGGSDEFSGEAVPTSYYYFHPWGWSSQAAHWALIFSHYAAIYGKREEDLGEVAVQVRKHAMTEPNAVMQKPMTIADYMASRYVVRPLHLFDICLVNDGAVCLIVRRADLAKDMPHDPVLVAGWGESKIRDSKMHMLVRERLRPQLQDASKQAFDMAGLGLSDIGHFEGYDAGTIHLIDQVEGFGFAPEGTGLDFCRAGEMTLGGRIPTNMAGGNLSGSYMQGWSQVAEVVRQLRHEAGARQIEGLQASLSAVVQTDQAHPLVLVRGE